MTQLKPFSIGRSIIINYYQHFRALHFFACRLWASTRFWGFFAGAGRSGEGTAGAGRPGLGTAAAAWRSG
jgi:hypothetical protein